MVAQYDSEKHLLGVSPNGIQHLTSLKNQVKLIHPQAKSPQIHLRDAQDAEIHFLSLVTKIVPAIFSY